MEGSFETNKHYRDLRDAFLLDNEDYRPTIYFDHRGIPTIFKGVALLTPIEKEKNDTSTGRSFDLHKGNLNACKKIFGKDSDEYKYLESVAENAKSALNDTPEPAYPKEKKNGKERTVRRVSFFQTTKRGEHLVQLMGTLNGRWELESPGKSIKIPVPSFTQSGGDKVDAEVIDQRERILDGYLKSINLDPAKLSEEQRIALVDALYHGRWNTGGVQAAKAIKNQKNVDEVSQCLNTPGFEARSKNVTLLLKKQWHPKKTQKKIPPSQGNREPGISPEQASLMKEYFLPQARPQQLGCSAYDQLMMRYSGAGCSSPLKNVCAPNRDLSCRYGD